MNYVGLYRRSLDVKGLNHAFACKNIGIRKFEFDGPAKTHVFAILDM